MEQEKPAEIGSMVPTFPIEERIVMKEFLMGNDRDNEPTPYRQGMGRQSWEQRFRDIQQELSHMKEAVKGRAPVSMDALVQQTESPFIARVLHFPLLAKFRMPQIEAFDERKTP